MINYVSLGMSCQTTHQLDFYTKQNPRTMAMVRSPFDWLICPPDSAAKWLDAGLCDFRPGEIVELLEHAYWPRFEFWFWHGFIDRTGGRRVLDLAGLAENELSKLGYLRKRFRSMDVSRTVFFISNTQNNLDTEVFEVYERGRYEFTETAIDRLQSALDRFFGEPVNLQVVTRPDRTEAGMLQRENVSVLPVDNSNWKGDKDVWGRLLNSKKC